MPAGHAATQVVPLRYGVPVAGHVAHVVALVHVAHVALQATQAVLLE